MSDYRSHLWGFTANEKEAYSGENDERQQILQLIIEEKQPEILELPGGGIQVHQEIDAAVAELIEQEALDELEQLVKAQPEAAADQQNPVEPHQDEDDKLSLDNLLEQHRWEGALRRLTRMVRNGEAINGPRDTPLGEDEATTHMENTCHAIHDYLKLYFPAYRPQIGRKVRGHQVSRVWELGERLGKDGGRCLACHKRVKGFNVTKLQNHLQGSVKRQGIQCPAINNYILSRLERILKEMNEDQ
uniref:Uncharacterized protein n=1 Tax=Oryza glumipatula TaxID=40148 RepID=A0A0E0BEH5_9ORYZ